VTIQRLHLGCGAKYLPWPWTNADGVAAPVVEGVVGHADIVLDINKDCALLPSNSIEWIYTSHTLEHCYPNLLPEILVDLCRALCPGGRLTIATTDYEGIYKHRYLSHDNGPYYKAALFGECNSNDHPMAAHRNVFTFSDLGALLSGAGFSSVRGWEYDEYPELKALNDYGLTCRLVSVLIEGRK
jgi:predicted SAM-dependent methyltransferase